ncbi:NAD(+) diphosphatase [Rufibacter hautae]|uniref:NAD(+) diphosphatase n=1 Tax=Rufibacter hautae TaxID=2595005 RepID=A0A5B6TIK2_9BACT|nr:NAD(+) diphosphatase [Rufibacter hautae]KAA3439199.1 NAD(+) diphosphatase [Rufibacter hautae]
MRNNLALSARNYFGEENLDRVHLLRKNTSWLEAQLTHPGTVFLPFQNLQPFLSEERQLVPFSVHDLQVKGLSVAPVLLGIREERAYFAVDVSETNYKPLAIGNFQELREATLQLPRPDSALLAYAKAMLHWNKQHQFCGVCGAPTLSKEAGHMRQCTNADCQTSHFPRTDTAVITMVTCQGKGLLARQASWPQGMYASIAGFLEPGETLEHAVAREVQEEVGLVAHTVQYHSSQPWPFPASIMVGFTAEVESTNLQIDPEEIEQARWFTREELKDLVATGEIKLPPALSISYRLIQDWLTSEVD